MKSTVGITCGLVAALLFGLSMPASKWLLTYIPPQLLAGLLYLGSGLGLSCVVLFRRFRGIEHGREKQLRRSDLPWLAGAVLVGGVAAPILLMFGLSLLDAASAALLLNLESVFTALVAWIIFRENVDRRIVLGMLAIVLGGLVLSVSDINAIASGQGLSVGSLLIATACFAWVLDNNLTRKISTSDPYRIVIVKGLVAGCINVGLAVYAQQTDFPGLLFLAQALVLGFMGYGISLVLFIYSLRYLGTSRAGAYFATAPLFGAFVSVLIGQSQITSPLLVASIFIAFGLWLHLSEKHDHEHIHEADEHEHAHIHDEHHTHEHGEDDPPGEPHSHRHKHERLVHSHPHYPDADHRHRHQVLI